jgi:hypothetical protein
MSESSTKDRRPATPIRCSGCDQTWTALGAAHCAACHITFSTSANFDRHRLSFECRRPADSGLVLNERGSWGQPGSEDADSRLWGPSQEPETPLLGLPVPGNPHGPSQGRESAPDLTGRNTP